MSRSSQWRNTSVLLGGLFLSLAGPGIAVSSAASVASPAAPVSGAAEIEGIVTSVSPSGESFTVGTTAFSFPDIPMGVLDRLRPGAFVHVQFAKEGAENVVTAISVQGPGRTSTSATWSRVPGEVTPRFGLWPGRTRGGS